MGENKQFSEMSQEGLNPFIEEGLLRGWDQRPYWVAQLSRLVRLKTEVQQQASQNCAAMLGEFAVLPLVGKAVVIEDEAGIVIPPEYLEDYRQAKEATGHRAANPETVAV